MLHPAEFVAASVAIILLPGPGQLAILTASFVGGRKAGFLAVAGLLTGDVCIMSATALGVATVLGLHPEVGTAIRWVGGLYICWIGLRTIVSRLDAMTAAKTVGGTPSWYTRTIGITLLNPKAILFFLSFFPLFMDPAHGLARSFLQMGALFTILSASYLFAFAMVGSAISGRLRASETASVWLPRALGAVILLFGGRMLLE